MDIVISNKSKLGLGQVKVTNENPIAKVNFSKVSKLVGHVALADLTDVVASNPQNGDTLVYNSLTQKYVIQTLPLIDGGIF